MRVLVTGAAGFVGSALRDVLSRRGYSVVLAVRTDSAGMEAGGELDSRMRGDDEQGRVCAVGEIGAHTDWQHAVHGCDAVVHLAARVHVMCDTVADPLAEFRAVNVAGTLNLARQAAAAGARRFIFLSSIKVNGEGACDAYRETDPAAPQDAYGCSKWEAERGLLEISVQTGMEVVILRPPLVYGPGVKANFLRLMSLVERGVPLPFRRIDNRRSLLYLGNLVDAIRLCLEHPAAANKTYLLSDGEDVSTPELVRRLARAMGRPARLLPVPPSWFALAGRLMGKRQEVERLLGSLTLDSTAIRKELGWRPPYTLDQGLALSVPPRKRY